MATIQLEHVRKVFPMGAARQVAGWLNRGQAKAPAQPTVSLNGRGGDDSGCLQTEEGLVALNDVNLTLPSGETTSVIGPSGCGKSTLLRVIAGLEPVTTGEVLYDRRNMVDVPPSERGIGIVFQSYALYPHKTSKGNLSFFFELHHREKEVPERVRHTAQVLGVDIEALLDRMPSTLSLGQRQRVALGRCIIRDPSLILLDEPLSNLDAKLRVQTRGELKKLLSRYQVTTAYVTHDQTEAIALADRLAVMRWGRIEQVGRYWDVYYRPLNTFVAGFVGTPSMNFLPAHIQPDGLAIDGLAERLPRPHDRYLLDRRVTFGIRPEDVFIAGGDVAALRIRADNVEYLPSDRSSYVYTTLAGRPFVARLKTDQPIQRGDVAPVGFVFEHASYFDPDSGQRVA